MIFFVAKLSIKSDFSRDTIRIKKIKHILNAVLCLLSHRFFKKKATFEAQTHKETTP
jgi:hypothetical protein